MAEFKVEATFFQGAVKAISAPTFLDERGFFSLSFLKDQLEALNVPTNFVREMYTRSKNNVLRGLHFQSRPEMGKLVQLIRGSIFAVVVDISQESPTFLSHATFDFQDGSNNLLWIPPDFAFGYLTRENDTIVHYNCTSYVGQESSIKWNDPDIGINWPGKNPILSKMDSAAPGALEYFRRENAKNNTRNT